MRILYVMAGSYGGWSAGEGRVQKFARGLLELGQEVRIVALRGPAKGVPAGQWRPDAFGVPYATVSRDFAGTIDAWRVFFEDRRRLFDACAAIIRDWQADVVSLYGNSWRQLGPLVAHCRRRRIPCVMDLNEWYRLRLVPHPLYWDYQLLFRRLFPSIGGVVAISRPWEEHCRRRGVPVIRIPALGEADAEPPAREPRGAAMPFTVVYLGPASARDLPDTLLEGVRQAVQAGLDARLVMIGDTSAYPAGRAAARKAQADPLLARHVALAGWLAREEVHRRLSESDATVLLRSDTWEERACFPTRLPEYLLTARPAILSAVGDLPLYFRHRHNAWLIQPGDRPRELAEAMIHLAAHPQESADIGSRGFRSAIEDFSFRRHAPALLDFLRRLRG
jgi:glycosyltransferase involved in cell wall biosynthesis